MHNRHNFDLGQFAGSSEDGNWPYADNVLLVKPDGTVATNGHLLVIVTSTPLKAKAFPKGEKAWPEGNFEAQEDYKAFLLPVEMAKQIVKVLPKKSTIPILAEAGVSVNGQVRIGVTDLKTPKVFEVPFVEGQRRTGSFPSYEHCLPADEPTFQVSVNPQYLAQLAKSVAKFVGDKYNPTVKLSFYASDRAIKLKAKNDEGQTWTALLMPCRE